MKRKFLIPILGMLLPLSLVACNNNTPEINTESSESIVESTESVELTEEIENSEIIEDTESSEANVEENINAKTDIEKASFLADSTYEELQKNIMISPLSLDMALGMFSEGADSDTLIEFQQFLNNENYKQFAKNYIDYCEQNSTGEIKNNYKTTINVANSFWGNQTIEFKEEFLKTLKDYYYAETQNVDFNNAESTSGQINSWIDNKTQGLIKNAVKPSDIKPEDQAILVNTVYFEDSWASSWGVYKNGEFNNIDGSKIKTEMLESHKEHFYYKNDKATAFRKNYTSGLSFIGILPNDKGEFNLSDLDIESLLKSETTEYDVICRMPKLNFETSTNMTGKIQKLGINKALTTNADFSKMSDIPSHLSKVIQSTKIELDEDGTKAAAATIAFSTTNAAPMQRETKEVFLDRPFAFIIYDNENQEILFIGKVVNIEK